MKKIIFLLVFIVCIVWVVACSEVSSTGNSTNETSSVSGIIDSKDSTQQESPQNDMARVELSYQKGIIVLDGNSYYFKNTEYDSTLTEYYLLINENCPIYYFSGEKSFSDIKAGDYCPNIDNYYKGSYYDDRYILPGEKASYVDLKEGVTVLVVVESIYPWDNYHEVINARLIEIQIVE